MPAPNACRPALRPGMSATDVEAAAKNFERLDALVRRFEWPVILMVHAPAEPHTWLETLRGLESDLQPEDDQTKGDQIAPESPDQLPPSQE